MKKCLQGFLIILTTISLFYAGCKHDPVVSPDPGGGNDCDTLNVTYNGTIYPLMQQYCLGCHSGATPSAGIDLNNYSVVAQLAQNGALLGAIRHESGYTAMPQNGIKLSDCDIAKFEIWIRDTTFNQPPPDCDTLVVTYPNTVFPLLQTYCISCHSGAAPSAGMDFNDYATIAAIAENGALLGAIKHLSGYSAMPKNGLKLTDCEIAKFEIWIRDTTFVEPPFGIPCDPDTVYFENYVLPLLQSSCGIIGCHDPGSATEGVILTDYTNIISTGGVRAFNPDNSEIYEKIMENDPDKIMPPPPRSPLTQEQKDAIYKWIMQGALNNHCENEDCDTLNVTFQATIWPVVQNRCFGCHSGASPSGGISLENYNSVVSAVSSGRLMGAIKHETGFSAMPKNGAKLSDCTISQFQKWINDGTPNN